jgi:two-component system chemotaxis sensor kinase CheA
MNPLLPLFLEETQELIDRASQDLVALEQGHGQPAALLDSVFRHFHTLKGGAALFGFAPMTGLMHAAEDVLDSARRGSPIAPRALADAMLRCLDDVQSWLPEVAATESLPAGATAQAERSHARLRALLEQPAAARAPASPAEAPDTEGLLRALLAEQSAVLAQGGPAAAASAALVAANACRSASLAAPARRIAAAAGDAAALQAAFAAALEPEAASPPPRMLRVAPERIEHIIALAGEAVVARNALQHAVGQAEHQAPGAAFIQPLKAQAATLDRLVRDWHAAAVRLRMVPVADIFARVPRLVRDVAHSLGRDVQVRMEGETLEADRDVLETLFEPLLHLVRNAVDHGIEDSADRQAAGKPATARLWLRARRTGETLVIEVEDDGRGLDLAALRARATDTSKTGRGLLTREAAEALTDDEAAALVFLPGLSTAARVSALSGRGVGMDAVRSAVQAAGGHVAIASRQGQGTRVSLSLPMRVSVTSVMIVEAAGLRFGVPLEAIRSMLRVPRAAIRDLPAAADGTTGQAFALDEQILPLVNLATSLGHAASRGGRDALVLVLDAEAGAAGLEVEKFAGRTDVILRPLTGLLAGLPCYLGSALLGDGSVLLVLDTQAILREA